MAILPVAIIQLIQTTLKKEKNNNSNNNEGVTNEQQNNSINPSNTDTNATIIDPTSLSNPPAGQCDQSLWDHVYHPERLQIIDRCKTVLGIIESNTAEADGDYHIKLKLDPQFSNLINSANVNGQFGDMVVEPIHISYVGSHVNVTGSYVLDNQHGGWVEIHPVINMVKIPFTNIHVVLGY